MNDWQKQAALLRSFEIAERERLEAGLEPSNELKIAGLRAEVESLRFQQYASTFFELPRSPIADPLRFAEHEAVYAEGKRIEAAALKRYRETGEWY